MSIIKEFKTFAIKGNVLDMAIGIVIGTAFGKIVASLVNDIIMPPLGYLIGGMNFNELKITISQAVADKPAVTMNYGSFIQVVIDFLLIAISVFLVIRIINKFKRKEELAQAPPVEPTPTTEEKLLTEIRDLLKKS